MLALFYAVSVILVCALVGAITFPPIALRQANTRTLRDATAVARKKWLSFWLIASVIFVAWSAYMRLPIWVLATRLVALFALAELLKRNRESSWLAILLVVTCAVTQSVTSRSAQLENGLSAVLADAAHLLFAAVWLGGVAVLCVVVRAAPNASNDMLFVLERFSPVALFCVVGLALTGIAQAGLLLGSFQALVGTMYGRTLLLKLVLFLGLIGFGAFHQQVLMPKLRRAILLKQTPHGETQTLRLSLLLEMLNGVALLVVVGVLLATSN